MWSRRCFPPCSFRSRAAEIMVVRLRNNFRVSHFGCKILNRTVQESELTAKMLGKCSFLDSLLSQPEQAGTRLCRLCRLCRKYCQESDCFHFYGIPNKRSNQMWLDENKPSSAGFRPGLISEDGYSSNTHPTYYSRPCAITYSFMLLSSSQSFIPLQNKDTMKTSWAADFVQTWIYSGTK